MENIEIEKELLSVTKELFVLMGVEANVTVTKNEDDSYLLEVDSEKDAGLLIGFRGENIQSLQTILGLSLKNKTGEWHRIVVNIGDYKEKQEDKLKTLAEQVTARALETSTPQPVYNLNASQRRIIHMYLSENKKVVTESEGVEPDRYLVVKPR